MSRESLDPESLTEQPAAWFTWANALTSLRLVAAPLCAYSILAGQSGAALLLFALAVVTDWGDGRVARRLGQASPLGGLLDHASDATFVSLGLGALACDGIVPGPLPFLIAVAFVQYTLDSRALRGRPLRTSFLGRSNGIAYFVVLGIPVVRDGFGLGWPGAAFVLAIGWALVGTTVASIVDRALALRRTRLGAERDSDRAPRNEGGPL